MSKANNQIFSCRATASLSSLIGNCSYIVKNFIVDLFPKDLFKRVYIDTSLTSNDFNNERDNVFNKEGFPYLVIKPRITFGDDSVFGKLPDWMCTNYYNFKTLDGNYTPVFADIDEEIYLYSVPDRIKLTFEIEIVCATKMQQINLAQFLKMSVLHRGYFYINKTKMETQVPKMFIEAIHNIMGFQNGTPEGHIEFTDYLETKSQSFITEKYNPATSDPSYFYLYQTNLLCIFEDYPNVDDGEVKDHSKTNFRINDILTVDFWVPSNYFLETKKQIEPEDFIKGWDITDLGEKVHMVYTMQLIPDKHYHRDGLEFDFYKKQGYITDQWLLNKNDEGIVYDTVDLSRFFKKDILDVIKYAKRYKLNIDNIIELKLYEENELLNPDKISMDWENNILTQLEPKPDTTYHLYAFINYKEYNRILKRLEQRRGNMYID